MITNPSNNRWQFFLIFLGLFAGWILSIISWMELCVEHCSANQDYRLFNLPFAPFGIAFFTALLFLHLCSLKSAIATILVAWGLASALGAEGVFIAVQKKQIGHWCPVCLMIAGSVAFAACVLLITFIVNLKRNIEKQDRGEVMKSIKRAFTCCSFLILGFFMAFIGISKPDSAEAAINDIKEKIAFGTKNKPVEIYFVTDWYCPSCKKIEPMIEKLYPKIKSNVTFYFVDYAVHKKSMNFTPYNISFMIHDKDNYFKARKLIAELADKTESPTDEQVEEMAKKNGLKFKELSFLDVKTGMEFFDKIVNKYDLHATPTIIITNPKRNTTVKMEGRDEISEDKIVNAIEKMTPAG